jgi:hypothetical protein
MPLIRLLKHQDQTFLLRKRKEKKAKEGENSVMMDNRVAE